MSEHMVAMRRANPSIRAEFREARVMRTLEDGVGTAIEVDLAVMHPQQRRTYAGPDQYRGPVEVRGVQELAKELPKPADLCYLRCRDGVAVSGDRAIRFADALLRSPLSCGGPPARATGGKQKARRYHFEPLKHVGASSHPNWEQAFEQNT